MEFYQDFNRRQKMMNLSSVLDFTPLTKPQKQHLFRVYSMLANGVFFTAIGCFFHMRVFAVPLFISLIAKLGTSIAVYATSVDAVASRKVLKGNRFLYFAGFTFFMGASIGDLVAYANFLNSSILLHAFFGSLAIFVCFSAAALVANERSYLYLGSILGSALTYLMFVSLFNMFFRSVMVCNIVVYGSLLLYMGFIVYDTQVTVESFNLGDRDYLKHAIQLYVDLVAIFIRLVSILSNSEEKKRKEKR